MLNFTKKKILAYVAAANKEVIARETILLVEYFDPSKLRGKLNLHTQFFCGVVIF